MYSYTTPLYSCKYKKKANIADTIQKESIFYRCWNKEEQQEYINYNLMILIAISSMVINPHLFSVNL